MFESAGPELMLPFVRQALLLVLVVSAPALLASLVVGVVVGAFQAATQLQDQTLAFVPKLVVVVLTLAISGPLLGTQVVKFAQAALIAAATLR